MVNLIVTNRCNNTIWPAINTQNGTGPSKSGFKLTMGKSQNLSVDANWNGRVWGRTNCTFDDHGNGNCLTGDCGGVLNCSAIVSRVHSSPNLSKSADDHVINRVQQQLLRSSICPVD
jgi:hypothetical protein